MPVASSIEADAADGNLDKWKGRIIIVDYTRQSQKALPLQAPEPADLYKASADALLSLYADAFKLCQSF